MERACDAPAAVEFRAVPHPVPQLRARNFRRGGNARPLAPGYAARYWTPTLIMPRNLTPVIAPSATATSSAAVTFTSCRADGKCGSVAAWAASCFPSPRSIGKKPVHPSICRKTLGLDPRRTGARCKAARRMDSLLRDRSGGTLRLFCFFNHLSARHMSCMSPSTSPSRSTRRMKRTSLARPPRYSHW